jgi:hypothetical protein
VASASVGADAHADHESAAGAGDEREQVLEESLREATTNSECSYGAFRACRIFDDKSRAFDLQELLPREIAK